MGSEDQTAAESPPLATLARVMVVLTASLFLLRELGGILKPLLLAVLPLLVSLLVLLLVLLVVLLLLAVHPE